ncbi:hypothetical protein UY3_09336 [Chelonia mydas]|uniref:Uncharacterized protein n=1 Tax=Chelonia mydas TaxID=8469 RepID=M7B8P6_CHEMY|nr:hypothetical protein UY3_09336 [Chelonia mydas]
MPRANGGSVAAVLVTEYYRDKVDEIISFVGPTSVVLPPTFCKREDTRLDTVPSMDLIPQHLALQQCPRLICLSILLTKDMSTLIMDLHCGDRSTRGRFNGSSEDLLNRPQITLLSTPVLYWNEKYKGPM